MSSLPVRQMILYKHGVGFFARQGTLSGESVALTFRQDEINDVLKSLAVFDRSGGQVLGIHYQTPMDQADRLANSSIRLSSDASLRDLLSDLRGRTATLSFEETPGTITQITGRVIGLDMPQPALKVTNTDPTASFTISVLSDDGQIRVYRLATLRRFTIHDTQSEHDLSYFLDTSMSEDARRTVNVRLSAGDHDLVVNYVAPSPTWRVSYRLVAESDENKQTGKALLQGWGLFDNRLEEDLEDVQVTLVAGQPISFIYDLYESRIPVRPTVKDESRIAPGPVEYEGEPLAWLESLAARQDAEPEERVRGITMSAVARKQVADDIRTLKGLDAVRVQPGMYVGGVGGGRPQDAAQSVPIAAQGKEAGEFFQYVVTAPVSVKRGESALVPIIGSEISYNRELLYNGAKLPNHPVAALRFKNTTGLTLERGPVTVVEDTDYKGEAVVPFAKNNGEVYLAYAVELGVRVAENNQYHTETAALNIEGANIFYEEYEVTGTTYILENTTANALVITVEEAIDPSGELFDTRKPDAETATERRWRVDVPARRKTEFTAKERSRTRRYEELRRLDYKKLQDFLENRWLDKATIDRLSEMLDNLGLIQSSRIKQEQSNKDRDKIYKRQEQLRANMSSLQPTGQEAPLRNRMVAQLEAAQDELDTIDRQVVELTAQITEAEKRVTEIIAGLSVKSD